MDQAAAPMDSRRLTSSPDALPPAPSVCLVESANSVHDGVHLNQNCDKIRIAFEPDKHDGRTQSPSNGTRTGLLSGLCKSTKCLIGIIITLTIIIIALVVSDQIYLHKLSTKVSNSNLNHNGNSNGLMTAASMNGETLTRYSQRDFHRDDDDDHHEHEHHQEDSNNSTSGDFFGNQDKNNNRQRNNYKHTSGFGSNRDFDDSFFRGSSFGGSGRDNQNNDMQHPAWNANSKWRDSDEPVCMSAGCVRAAAQILNNMDNKTNPCDNFYRFACGRWIDSTIIPDEKISLSVFSQMTAELNVQLRALVEAKPVSSNPPIVGQMRNLYASCMNLSEIEARGDEPLLEVLRDLGGWPVLTHRTSQLARDSSSPVQSSLPPALATTSTSTTTQIQPMTTTTPATAPASSVLQRRSASNFNAASSLPIPSAIYRTPSATGGRNSISSPINHVRAAGLSHNVGSIRQPRQAVANEANQQQWLDTLIKFRRRGFSHDMIIDLSVVVDIRNNTRYIVDLDQSSLGMPDRGYYFKGMNDTTVAAYYKLMVDAAMMLGAPAGEARFQMREAFDFETQLAKISVGREQRRNVSRMYNKMPAIELYKLAPNIDWKRYLRSLLNQPNFNMEQEEIVVKMPAFLRQLDELLIKTEPRIISNYMIWRIIRQSMISLGRKWRELAHGYNSVTTGRQVEEPRWEMCLSSLEGTLAPALSALYVKNHFNQASKESAMEMVDYIRGEFLRMLDEVDWMDEETRREAKLKAQAITPYIGYPDELLDDSLIEEYYTGLKMARSNYYNNLRQLRVWSTNHAFSQLRKPNKRGDWKKHARAAVVNAYYNSLDNSIEFPAGILRGAFFDAERPNYMNFGAIGYVIGHEITHGFDDRGRQYDKDGQDRFWWKPKTDARFRERAQCIIEQYGNYTVKETGLNVNGLNTQGENIADNGGIKESYRAYQRWQKDHGREGRLPGLTYSSDQLFWISAANIWCGKFRPEMLKLRVNSGSHSPAEFRIIGPFSNSPDFSKSFNCPLGSPMNPQRKCTVW